MQCEEFRDLIEGYLAESLDDDQRALFRTHLRSCVQCRERAMSV
jgi:predicted anti-sigma-YlaC factor YlaD